MMKKKIKIDNNEIIIINFRYIYNLKQLEELFSIFKKDDKTNNIDINQLINYQNEDQNLQIVKNYLISKRWIAEIPRKIKGDTQNGKYKLNNNGILIFKKDQDEKIVIPRKLVNVIINLVHNSFIHKGISRVINHITKDYYWYNYQKDIKDFINNCNTCQSTKNNPILHSAKFVFFKPQQSNQILGIDFIGVFPRTEQGFINILTIVDLYDGYTLFIPTFSQSSSEWIITFINKYIYKFGVPETILMDNGPAFRSEMTKIFSQFFGLNLKFISPYHHKSNGKAERRNRICRELLKIIGYDLKIKQFEDFQWDQYLDLISFIVNITIEPDLKLTPFELRFNTQPPDPSRLLWKNYLGIFNNNNTVPQDFNTTLKKQYKLIKQLKKQARINLKEYTDKKYKKHLIEMEKKKIVQIKEGDYCRIKNLQFSGNKRKFKASYSSIHKIIQLNSFRNSVLVVPIKDNINPDYSIINKKIAFWRNIDSIKLVEKPKLNNN